MSDESRAVTRDVLEARLDFISKELKRIENIVCGNGKPGLEDKIMAQVTQMLSHQRGNWKQGDVDLEEMIKHEKEDRMAQHAENLRVQENHTKILIRLERAVWCAGAVFMVFKLFGIENILKMLRP